MTYTNYSGNWSQALEALASEHAQIQSDLSKCRCSKCDRFGVVSDTHEYYSIIYKCNCQPVFWVISLETGNKLEGG